MAALARLLKELVVEGPMTKTAQVIEANTSDHADSGRRWSLAAGWGAVGSALVASACCVGPLLLALLGIGGAGLLLELEPFRPYFVALTLALLGAGFYLSYRGPRRASSGIECDCPAPRASRAGRVMLWVATLFVAAFLLFPYFAPVLFG